MLVLDHVDHPAGRGAAEHDAAPEKEGGRGDREKVVRYGRQAAKNTRRPSAGHHALSVVWRLVLERDVARDLGRVVRGPKFVNDAAPILGRAVSQDAGQLVGVLIVGHATRRERSVWSLDDDRGLDVPESHGVAEARGQEIAGWVLGLQFVKALLPEPAQGGKMGNRG